MHLYVTAGSDFGPLGRGRTGVGPSLLVTRVAPTLTPPVLDAQVAAIPRTDLDPAIGASARWDFPVAGRVDVFLAATLDLLFRRPEYTEMLDGATVVLFAPWQVRPGLALGLSFSSEARPP